MLKFFSSALHILRAKVLATQLKLLTGLCEFSVFKTSSDYISSTNKTINHLLEGYHSFKEQMSIVNSILVRSLFHCPIPFLSAPLDCIFFVHIILLLAQSQKISVSFLLHAICQKALLLATVRTLYCMRNLVNRSTWEVYEVLLRLSRASVKEVAQYCATLYLFSKS